METFLELDTTPLMQVAVEEIKTVSQLVLQTWLQLESASP
jgi:hypothetical protein